MVFFRVSFAALGVFLTVAFSALALVEVLRTAGLNVSDFRIEKYTEKLPAKTRSVAKIAHCDVITSAKSSPKMSLEALPIVPVLGTNDISPSGGR